MSLLDRCETRRLTRHDLLADPDLASHDPELRSLINLNHPDDYEQALTLAPPQITITLTGSPRPPRDVIPLARGRSAKPRRR